MSGIFPLRQPAAQTGPSSDGYPGDARARRLLPGCPPQVELQAANGAGLSVEANLYDGDERVATLRQQIGTQAIDEKGCMTIAPSCG